MEKLQLRRSAIEGRLGYVTSRVQAMQIATACVEDLDVELDSLRELWQDFRTVHDKILEHCVDEDLEEHLEYERSIETSYNRTRATLLQFKRLINNRNEASTATSNTNTSSQESSITPVVPELQLPKGILPIFSGDYGEWTSFFDLFKSSVDQNTRLTKAQKLVYLKTYTSGRAAALLRHIKIEDRNYEGALEVLKRRFDRQDQIISHHIQRFLDIPSFTVVSASNLARLHDTADDVRRALQAIQREDRDCWLVHLLQAKLDTDTRHQWHTRATMMETIPTLTAFLEFVEQRVYTLETSRGSSSQPANRSASRTSPRSTSLAATNRVAKPICAVCGEGQHRLFCCRRFNNLSVADRIDWVKRLGRCENCPREGHGTTGCSYGTCKQCNQRHHTLLHEDRRHTPAQIPGEVRNHLSYNDAFCSVFLSTAIVNVLDASGNLCPARALLDSGSQACFITTDLSKKLGLDRRHINLPLRGISGLATRIHEAVSVTIQSRNSDFRQQTECAILDKISEPIPHQAVNITQWGSLADLALADERFHIPGNIDLLIGASMYYHLLEPEQISLGPSQPILQRTKLGWIVAGFHIPEERLNPTSSNFSTRVEAQEEPGNLNQLVAKFWELEDFKPTTRLTVEEQLCEDHFQAYTTRDSSGRYVVKLPFRKDPSNIGDTRYSALRQYHALKRRLNNNPEHQQLYEAYVGELIAARHIEPMPAGPSHKPTIFLPHHAVLKEESSTTKLRVVFNGSLKSSNGFTLNDLLMTGPVVQESLYNILLNFRLHRIALIGDIEKMYLQVRVTEEDSQLIRMLWQEPGRPMTEFGMRTVIFGLSCAPFLATRALKQLAVDYGDSFPLAKKGISDFYVDDLLSGASSVREAIETRRQMTHLLRRGGFTMRKWATNDPTVLKDIPVAERASLSTHHFAPEASLKTLGVRWHVSEDLFSFSVNCNATQTHYMKREVLSTIAKIFDPLGLIGPIVIVAKTFMQELWKLDIDWSDPLPELYNVRWRSYLAHLQETWHIKIPRRCLSIDFLRRVYLHGYCDASETAYGAVLYLRAVDEVGNVSSRLLCSKSKVTPINRPTIPRLELCAATLLARLIKTVKSTLRMTIHQTTAWSDSMTTLAWIAGDPARWKTFVANRVAEINSTLSAVNWRHIPTDENPADLLSRGATPMSLASTPLWWSGPTWRPEDTFELQPDNLPSTVQRLIDKERRQSAVTSTHVIEFNSLLDGMLSRYSSYIRLIRVTAWILRFGTNCQRNRTDRRIGPLQPTELHTARDILVRHVQHQYYPGEIAALTAGKALPNSSKLWPLTPFLDGSLLRVGGRLARSNINYDCKHPILLPAKSTLTELILRHEHLSNHHLGPEALLASIRRCFWIPQGRRAARNVVWKCIPCFKANPNRGMLEQIMGQLPPQRLEAAPPFYICGLDYGGPITLIQRRGPGSPTTKGYICVFVCFTTRAVHLEAVSSLSTRAFLAALRRFIARRGHCGHIHSDNGTNFVGAAREIREWYKRRASDEHNTQVANYLSMGGTQWHFNAPASPHMGGLWEAAIKSAKRYLKIITGNAKLTFEEFSTLLADIEAILNSRPISPASSDPNDLQPLTPAHFIIGRPLTAPNHSEYIPTADKSYEVRYKYLHELRKHFWDRWSREYLPELQRKNKWHQPSNNLQIGDLVLVRRQKLPTQQWALGRVLQLKHAPDGKPRLVTLKMRDSEIVQSVHNLSKLPLQQEN
ncbi:uncharacterized protein LOC129773857 [Toxorhynchites rutilus septentrionalis]|uniref:uncharacterized protein LOC129773857 n=1 Tax=Toxorhynchites rutilus septentrionalis TaxID=329112 RepID=UPI00247A7618|nr:uncharacterized protein LOC129773857 [Toxorhynchites rutilus septentrionalis]